MKNATFNYFLACCFTVLSLSVTAQGIFPSAGIYRLQNCETNEFLTAGNPPTMSTAMDITTEWQIVQNAAGNYNIDAQTSSPSGVLRATSSNVALIGTNKAPPTNDADKSWTITYDATDDCYTFTHLNGNNRDMTIGTGGIVTINNNDDPASKWKVVDATLPLDFVDFKGQDTKAGTQLTWEVSNVILMVKLVFRK